MKQIVTPFARRLPFDCAPLGLLTVECWRGAAPVAPDAPRRGQRLAARYGCAILAVAALAAFRWLAR